MSEFEPPAQAQERAGAEIVAFWERARSRVGLARLPVITGVSPTASVPPPAWAFGDTPRLADALLALVLTGTKTASASAAWEYEAIDQPLPRVGDLSIIVDGRGKTPGQGYDGGNWMGPTIIDHTTAEMEISKSEVFGPVISIIRVPNLTAALAIENDNPYGNAASVFTTNGAIAQHVADHARAGMIGVNIGVPVPREPFSFGGIQDSKFGTGDITGESSLNFWSHIKKITRKWSAQTDKSWMS